MNMQNPIAEISTAYASCITRTCHEKKCSLTLDGISDRAIIDGSKYQKLHRFNGKLCDRIVFCQHNGFLLAAVELKGGKSTRITTAIAQIQNGLTLAEEMLGDTAIAGWLPVLLYSGHVHGNDTQVLRNTAVSFQGNKKPVVKEDCGASLREIITHQA